MKVAYFDLVAGASGDMILAGLVDAGLPFAELEAGLAGLRLPGFRLSHERVQRGAFACTKIDVHVAEGPPARHLPEIATLIQAGDLPEQIKSRAMHIFERMIDAEAAIHNMPAGEVHLHELGAIDTIVDVCGCLLGLHRLGIGRVVVSPFPLARGLASSAHGRMPLPAPATLALLAGAPVVGVEHALETVTPTAAALLTELADSYGPIPAMRLQATGYGAGTRIAPEPNLLRVLLGEADPLPASEAPGAPGLLDLLETNIDDMNPEAYGYLFEQLLAAGALDVYLTPVLMKKNRPGSLLSVLCRPSDTTALRALLFAETTTLGVRTQQVARHALPRRIETVETRYGPIRLKVCRWGESAEQERAAPEYEDCARAAREHGVPLSSVYEAARAAWRRSPGNA